MIEDPFNVMSECPLIIHEKCDQLESGKAVVLQTMSMLLTFWVEWTWIVAGFAVVDLSRSLYMYIYISHTPTYISLSRFISLSLSVSLSLVLSLSLSLSLALDI